MAAKYNTLPWTGSWIGGKRNAIKRIIGLIEYGGQLKYCIDIKFTKINNNIMVL